MELNEFFTTVILTAAVFAALVTSIANIIISLMNNWRLKKIEKQKQMNEIDKYRYSRLSQTARFMRVPIITMLFLSAKMKAEHRNMLPCEALSAALSSRTHRAATSGIRSDFWQESLRIPCIYLKPPLICCPMPLI